MVVSISKIPDRIQQIIQECSRIMDISEQVLQVLWHN
jgi:DNA primase